MEVGWLVVVGRFYLCVAGWREECRLGGWLEGGRIIGSSGEGEGVAGHEGGAGIVWKKVMVQT